MEEQFAHLQNLESNFNDEEDEANQSKQYKMSFIQSIRESATYQDHRHDEMIIPEEKLAQFEQLFLDHKEEVDGENYLDMTKEFDLDVYNITQDELLEYLGQAEDEGGNFISQTEYYNVMQMFVDRLPDTTQPNELTLSKDMIFDSKLSVQSTNKIVK